MLRESGRVEQVLLVDISRSRKINKVLGGAFVAPWEVASLSEEWLDAFDGLYEYEKDVARAEKQKAAAEAQFEKVRRKHPTFRK